MFIIYSKSSPSTQAHRPADAADGGADGGSGGGQGDTRRYRNGGTARGQASGVSGTQGRQEKEKVMSCRWGRNADVRQSLFGGNVGCSEAETTEIMVAILGVR